MTNLKKILHISLGITLILVGLCGLVLPILNGTVFLLLGCILLSFESPYVEHHLTRLAHKNSRTGDWYEKLRKLMKKWFRV